MANLFLLSRKAFVMCYCFRAPIKTFFFFPSIYGPRASRLGHKSMEKNSVRNLQYGPKTRLMKGIYSFPLFVSLKTRYLAKF